MCDYLLIGHLCHDVVPGGHALGGTVAYSGLAAKKLGLSPGILTSVGSDFLFQKKIAQAGIELTSKPAERTTIFENVYTRGERTQYLHARAADLTPADVPPVWRSPKIVQCSPIADEVSPDLLGAFPGALIGATIQGWLRQWDRHGHVSPKAMDWSSLAAADVVIFSDADIRGFEDALPEIILTVQVVVMTQGSDGATVWQTGKRHHFPAYPALEVDATGAGDVFAAAFLVRFFQTKDIGETARFANAAASLVVEHSGTGNTPALSQITHRMEGGSPPLSI